MGQKLATRLQRIFRGSQEIPEGADTSDEHWEDLPYGGPVRFFTRPSSRAFVREINDLGAGNERDDERDPEWLELLSWAKVADVASAAASLPAEPLRAAAEPSPTDEAEEWAAALARAKTVATTSTSVGAPGKPAVAALPLAAPPLSVPTSAPDEAAEWAACLARAKAETSAADVEAAEWAATLARAKAEEVEWRARIQRARIRPTAREEVGNLAKLIDRMRAGSKGRAVFSGL
jgi:hypothetical protein